MDVQRVDMYLLANQKNFPVERMPYLRDRLLQMDESRFGMLTAVEMKDPTTSLLLSLFLGVLGIDRFYIGDTGLGVLKLLTGGVCGVMAIVDWFLIMGKTREKNFERLMSVLG